MFKPRAQELLNIGQFCQRKFTKSKLKFGENFGQSFGIVEKPLMSRILGGSLIIFRHKVVKILNFE
jgi:hypothetical protein